MEKQSTTPTKEFNWTQKSRSIIKFKDQKEITGLFTGIRSRMVQEVNQETGEVKEKEITDLCLTTPENNLIAVAVDTGLKLALSSSDIDIYADKPNQVWLKMVRGNQKDLGGGKRVNTYEVFIATKH